ncbi:uncharacterized protein L201_001223 [Kwoniella dendrophila CBS 6074]|uniref:Peptidase M50 domain-containing protein n=1 Tax=Kwoniella dendrophila CBS 6074 TaxID=1295534 RepID=A0AAX4JLU0_9TREE
MGASHSIGDWIEEGSDGEWSPSHPSDAQRESIVFLVGSLLVILVFWQGKIPIWYSFRKKGRTTIPFPMLVPFKLLTVLYHEIGHAVVGKLTIWYKQLRYGIPIGGERGRIEFIMVDWYEGGWTKFGGDVEPIYSLTLPAGYLASCLVGCWFLFTGFDAKWSKFGAISLIILTTIATLICFFIKAKSGLVNNWYFIQSKTYKWLLCNEVKSKRTLRKHNNIKYQRNENARYKHDDDVDGPTEHDLRASQDLITACSIIIGIIITLAWMWDDSIYLRFVMLFMGLLSALYAVWDIILDGLKYAKVAKSDITYMAEEHNRRVKQYNKNNPEKRQKSRRSTKFYAIIWLFTKTDMIILVIVLAYFVFKKTKVEQAIESREFLPAKFHYGPSDLEDDFKLATGKFKEGMNDLVGHDN